jgi:hypothetical protein
MCDENLSIASRCVSDNINRPGQNDHQALRGLACFGKHLARTVRPDRAEASYPLNLGMFKDQKDLVASCLNY